MLHHGVGGISDSSSHTSNSSSCYVFGIRVLACALVCIDNSLALLLPEQRRAVLGLDCTRLTT
jgi:hypothetical protein